MKNDVIKKRIEWVDIFKGFMIILMVIGHSNFTFSGKWIYTFHMASFFFISGFCTNYDKDDSSVFFWKKFRRLIVPFYVWNIVVFLFQYFLTLINLYDTFYASPFSINTLLILLKYQNTLDLSGATWFLPSFFLATMVCRYIYDLVKNKISSHSNNNIDASSYVLVISTILFLFNYYFFNSVPEGLGYCLDLVFVMSWFISWGYFYKKVLSNVNNIFMHIIKIIIIGLSFYLFIYKYQQVELVQRIFPTLPTYIIYTLGGIFLFEYISKIFSKINLLKDVLIYVGKNTMEIMLFHFIGFRIMFYILYKVGYVGPEQLQNLIPIYTNFWIAILTAIFAIIVSLIIGYIYHLPKKIIKSKNISDNKNNSVSITNTDSNVLGNVQTNYQFGYNSNLGYGNTKENGNETSDEMSEKNSNSFDLSFLMAPPSNNSNNNVDNNNSQF